MISQIITPTTHLYPPPCKAKLKLLKSAKAKPKLLKLAKVKPKLLKLAREILSVAQVLISLEIPSSTTSWGLSVSLSLCLSVSLSLCLYHIKPTLSHSPDKIILQIGTNNLKKDNPDVICKKIEELCNIIRKDCPKTKIALSEITPRNDFKDARNAREQVNNKLQSLRNSQNFTLISHPTILDDSLNGRGVHLNRKGTALLSKDFKNYIYKD